MRKHVGWIALDIDGTITDKTHHAPREVIDYLHTLEKRGWDIVFITGRTFSYAWRVVKEFNFPYYLAIQNGADILCMPQKQLVARRYLDHQALPFLESVYKNEKEDFILYSGFEKGDFCYYRPHKFSPALKEHLQKLMSLSPEPWQRRENFQFEQETSFPLAYCLGNREGMERINALVQTFPNFSSTMIRDPLSDGIYLILVTSKDATKGSALSVIKETMGDGGPVIAAGDDLNDVSMLERADVKIVMASAPKQMHGMATILADHGPDRHGIIDALERAVDMV